MATALPLPDHRHRAFEALQERLQGSPPWLAALRRQAFARLGELGFPTTRHEDWKYTSVRSIVDTDWGRGGLSPAEAPITLPGFTGPRLTFVNGRFAPELSDRRELPEGVLLTSFGEALAGERRQELEPLLASTEGWRDEPFACLNTASFEDGAVLIVPEGCRLESPVQLQFLSAPEGPTEQHPRVLIAAGANSEVHVVETWSGAGGEASFSNAVGEVVLGENAKVEHVKLQREAVEAAHLAWTGVRQGRDSRYRLRLLSLGGGTTRNGLRVDLVGEGADAELDGLYAGDGSQHVDNQIFVRHAVPHTTSRQLFKSVLTDRAHGIFTGCVLVEEDAQKIEAHQQNRNLVLSENAVADTRPQLEIYADDVKCSHGATIGRLDETALFYLRSRGLPLEAARSLLTQAFALEILERVQVPVVAAELCAPVRHRLEEISQ